MKILSTEPMCEALWLLEPDIQQHLDVLQTTDEWTALADGKEITKALYAGFQAYLRTISSSSNFERVFLESQWSIVRRYLTTLKHYHSELTDLQARMY